MNHGSLGFLSEAGELSLKQDILNTLCLGVNSKLYGIYYPLPPATEDARYIHATLKHDFMLTPIPPRLWPVSARIHIHLLQMPGTLNKLCSYFNTKGISIVHAESTRSAHRYATWSLHIAFEELLSKASNLTYDNNKHYYNETFEELEKVKKDFEDKNILADTLFIHDYLQAVHGGINSPLAYFTNFMRTADEKKWIEEAWLVNPFELTLQENKRRLLLTGDQQFQSILEYLKSKEEKILPAITFSEVHTGALNIRTVLIPQSQKKRFFMVGIEYERVGGLDSCKGLINTVTKNIPAQYNIWQSYNYTINSSPAHEKGNLVFLMEDMVHVESHIKRGKEDPKKRETYVQEAEDNIKSVISNHDIKNVKFNHLSVIPLPDAGSMKRLVELNHDERGLKNFEHDVFISYSHTDKKYVDKLLLILANHGIECIVDMNSLNYGDIIDEQLLQDILNSREMCVFVSPSSNTSEWVHTEWGAAWILNMPLVPIILGQNIPIPERLKKRFFVQIDDINDDAVIDQELIKYAQYLKDKKYLNEANRFIHFFSR